ncbi:MAG: YidC/Oxa1 family insertase periplasmic-domain containing protein [Gemmatimonadaceae bacterium]
MDKRFFLALVLTAIVIIATPLLFPNANRRSGTVVPADSMRRAPVAPETGAQPLAPSISSSAPPSGTLPSIGSISQPIGGVVETTTVRALRSTYAFTSRGAAPVSIVLDSYPSRRPGAMGRKAELVQPRSTLARYRLALGRDTIALDSVTLRVAQRDSGVAPRLTYAGEVAGHALRLEYVFVPDSFLVRVTGTVANAPPGSALLTDLPRTLRSNEPDTLDDLGHLAVSYRRRSEVQSVGFSKLDTAEIRREAGPIDWVATRNKYFLVAYRAGAKQPFSSLELRGAPRRDKVAAEALATVAQPLSSDGRATFDLYAGPQDFERLQRLGGDLDQVNPYGGWLQGVVQPFATIVMKALLWMKHTTQLNYGWVLVLFGVLIRLALWPLNQGAMRTSMKMQRLQPELQALQKKHGDDPKRQQEAIMKVYKDHGMSPLSPLMGCLPMLLPMPILFALYFVFQNTIEFRGVSFLWLPDISLKDPFYITPLLMGVSMFVMSWIGMKGAPPNPQAKMMTYMMPVMLTVLFLNFASGLNLYYAVQNIAALPQQWLLARERSLAPPTPVATISGPSAAVKRRS